MHHEDDIKSRLERIEFQLDRIISDIESEKGIRKERSGDTEKRLRYLENKVATMMGAAVALGVISTLISIITAFIKLKN